MRETDRMERTTRRWSMTTSLTGAPAVPAGARSKPGIAEERRIRPDARVVYVPHGAHGAHGARGGEIARGRRAGPESPFVPRRSGRRGRPRPGRLLEVRRADDLDLEPARLALGHRRCHNRALPHG